MDHMDALRSTLRSLGGLCNLVHREIHGVDEFFANTQELHEMYDIVRLHHVQTDDVWFALCWRLDAAIQVYNQIDGGRWMHMNTVFDFHMFTEDQAKGKIKELIGEL